MWLLMSHYLAVTLATFSAIATTWIACSVAHNQRLEKVTQGLRLLVGTQQQELRRLRQLNQDLSYKLSQYESFSE
jgi:hypothetical protein